jgi:hypothetical protein
MVLLADLAQQASIANTILVLGVGLGFALVLFWIWMAVDCLAYEDDGNLRTVWLLVLLFGGWPGALFYFFLRRRQRLQMAGTVPLPPVKYMPAAPVVAAIPIGKQPFPPRQPAAWGLGTLAAVLLAVVAVPGILIIAACAGLFVFNHWHFQRQQEGMLEVAMQPVVEPAAQPLAAMHPPPGLPLSDNDAVAVSDELLCEWAGEWQPVQVLQILPDGRLKIHWIGWSDGFDEVVPRSRLRRIESARAAGLP